MMHSLKCSGIRKNSAGKPGILANSPTKAPRAPRGGAALMGVVVALAVLSLLMAAITWQNVANRKLVQRRHHQLQSAWLARSGVENAVARLLKDRTYKGEDQMPLESSRVKITVVPEKSQGNIFHITCEARFPDNKTEAVVRSVTRRYRRVVDGGKIRMEVVSQ